MNNPEGVGKLSWVPNTTGSVDVEQDEGGEVKQIGLPRCEVLARLVNARLNLCDQKERAADNQQNAESDVCAAEPRQSCQVVTVSGLV